MCTAINQCGEYHLFGRTLDLECSYGESVVLTPRNFPLKFTEHESYATHHAILGVATVCDGYPLYYDAINEMGLCAAGLNFPVSAVFHQKKEGTHGIASFELIPFILGKCRSISEAVELFKKITVTNTDFSKDLPSTPLHWIFADKHGAVTVESVADGVHIYDNSVGVLTNEPPFPYHTTNMTNYMALTSAPPQNTLCPKIHLTPYSRGMGAWGLPGDSSSASRFVRAVYAKNHTLQANTMTEAISQFFHILDTVSLPLGYALTENGTPTSTIYSSCGDTSDFAYYFTTYGCRRIHAVKPHTLHGSTLTLFPMSHDENIEYI